MYVVTKRSMNPYTDDNMMTLVLFIRRAFLLPREAFFMVKTPLQPAGPGVSPSRFVRDEHSGACVCFITVCVLLLQDLLQSCSRGGGGEWRTCAMRDDEPRPVWMSLPITH
jgi:hypothetical protein